MKNSDLESEWKNETCEQMLDIQKIWWWRKESQQLVFDHYSLHYGILKTIL